MINIAVGGFPSLSLIPEVFCRNFSPTRIIKSYILSMVFISPFIIFFCVFFVTFKVTLLKLCLTSSPCWLEWQLYSRTQAYHAQGPGFGPQSLFPIEESVTALFCALWVSVHVCTCTRAHTHVDTHTQTHGHGHENTSMLTSLLWEPVPLGPMMVLPVAIKPMFWKHTRERWGLGSRLLSWSFWKAAQKTPVDHLCLQPLWELARKAALSFRVICWYEEF